jgi:hypothetical protein
MAEATNEKVIVRPAVDTDYPFIFATWLRQLYYSKDNKSTLPKETFMRLHHNRIEGILATTPVKVACLESDPDIILAYRVACDPAPWYYAKKSFRLLDLKRLMERV